MKKTIASLFAAALLIPSLASAQTMTPEQRTLTIQLISLLQQEVVYLQHQLSAQSTGSAPDQAGSTIEDMPDDSPTVPALDCSLSFSVEGALTSYDPSTGTTTSMPNGQFRLYWKFPPSATAILSGNGDEEEFENSSDSRAITIPKGQDGTRQPVSYTLTVSQEGYQDAVCSATATPA